MLFLAAAAWFVVSRYWAELESCRDEVARVGANAAVSLCGPVDITALAPLVLLGLLLLLPDADEVSIAGVGSLKRRVEAQEKRQDSIQERLANIETRATAISNPVINID